MVALQLPQTFHRVQCESHLQLAQDRWTYFIEKVSNTLIARVYNRGEEREYRTSSIMPLKFKMQSHMTNGWYGWSMPGARDLLGILNIRVRYSLSSLLLYTLADRHAIVIVMVTGFKFLREMWLPHVYVALSSIHVYSFYTKKWFELSPYYYYGLAKYDIVAYKLDS